MTNIFKDFGTADWIRTIEQIKPEASWLPDTLFPNVEQSFSEVIPIEYTKAHRRLAPYVVKGARGLNVEREGSTVRLYRAPIFAAKRTVGLNDISQRIIGEQPIFSSKTPADRASEIMARDLKELKRMHTNRKSQMVSELIHKGKITIKGYADDGAIVEEDEINFEMPAIKAATWTAANADILGDLQEASEEIQENTGVIPTLLICGSQVVKAIQNNKVIQNWLWSSNVNAVKWLNFTPQYDSPQSRFIGYIGALNLEIRNYAETYIDDDGQVKPFIASDAAVLCNPGRGRQLYGAVSYLSQSGAWETAAAQEVPVYTFNVESQTSALTVYSRCLVVPQDSFDFITFKLS